ncbi:SLBB domain-containing protein [Draconibacterium halophilum]|uniref:Sugar transporter n=1 Tax=Draconibacterium halophilum TaxID=2706887 RepID=A0A6C0RF96_9BACT|nr:SLBB domain-containing protein [Draconibacterium halophilum]QIA08512.1 sugar transporter [Draconibacterium halophilum]
MKHLLQTMLTVFFCLAMLLAAQAQTQDVKNVDVKSLSQSEIDKAQKAMSDAGLSEEEAIQLARQRGATEQQISDMRKRLQEQDTSKQNMYNLYEEPETLPEEQEDTYLSQRKAELRTDLEVFGAYLFNNENLTFEPQVNIQTPKNYEIGFGDQLLIQIWGNSQNTYQLRVNNNGQIVIPDLGPVYVAGLSFDEAEKKIVKNLTAIYADMGADNPGTFAQLDMGQLRSIRVNMLGEVVTPGTYTLPVTATVFNGLYLSGGPNEIGSFRNIKVIRNNKIEKVIDIYNLLINADPSDNITLKDGDIVIVPPAEKQVVVNGEFKRNGIFEIKEGEMLNDLVRFAGGFNAGAFLGNTQIVRKTQQGQQIIDVPYEQLGTTPLVKGDTIQNTLITDRFENRVSIEGAVYHPGEYEWTEGLSLAQLIEKADKLLPEAFKGRGLITRYNSDRTTSAIAFDVEDINSGKQNILLQPDDEVLIKTHFDLKEQPYITVNGEVLEPGPFNWSKGMTLGDAIFLAGGLTEGADSTFIEIARRLSYNDATVLSDTIGHVIIANISRGLQFGKNDAEMKLQPWDQVSVRTAPNFKQNETVFISGEVTYAGAYAITNKQMRISDLVQMAGGTTPKAYLQGATLERFSEELGAEQVAINLQNILNTPRSDKDLLLKNSDRLNIPEFMQTVKIIGSVQNPFSITFESGRNARYYVERTGGFQAQANKKKTYVQYPNGETAVTKGFIFRRYPKVTPGSVVVVPEKPEKERPQGLWLAIASTMSSMAVAIATVINVSK